MPIPGSDPEALAQLARLLGDERLRAASSTELGAAVDEHFDALVAGLADEAAASDDVIDQASALEFLKVRLDFLGALLSSEQTSRLWQAVQAKIEAW
ncbi:MAG TPA: hypothetical protein VFY10_15495 [Dehalococcoidia bacterium]|nr:hypothetical protein [Dehalococcoidia bacterium]